MVVARSGKNTSLSRVENFAGNSTKSLNVNPSKWRTGFRELCIFAILASSICLKLEYASAQTPIVPPVSVNRDPLCVASTLERCLLRAVHRSIEMRTGSDRRLQIVFKNFQNSDGRSGPIAVLLPVSEDLDARVVNGEMTVDEATHVWLDLANSDGTFYTLPDLTVLKSDLGFPAAASFSDDDLMDLCRAHLQSTLSVAPLTAEYLTERMGLEFLSVDFVPDGQIVAGASSKQLHLQAGGEEPSKQKDLSNQNEHPKQDDLIKPSRVLVE